MLGSPAIDAERVIGDLRELARRTSDERGAQRVAWTDGWHTAREFLGELLGEIGLGLETDEAGNCWARLEGGDPNAPAVAVGSHLDSVPDGGWLDGALGVLSAVGVLRANAADAPPRPLVLVDWADEEGSRFGRSLFGSSAFAGTLDPASVRDLTDADGRRLTDVLASYGVDIDSARDCSARREGIGAYLELHIEQGPILERAGRPAAAVTGCQGVERVRFEFRGQASHAGTTPMDMRRDAGLAAAALALAIEELPARHGGVATTGELVLEPGISTAVAGVARLSCDLRNPDAGALATMLGAARDVARKEALSRSLELAEEPLFSIEPIAFDPGLVALVRESVGSIAGEEQPLQSGALHDAAEVARVIPAAMIFCPSRGGVSHDASEDTEEEDLAVAIRCFGELAARTLQR